MIVHCQYFLIIKVFQEIIYIALVLLRLIRFVLIALDSGLVKPSNYSDPPALSTALNFEISATSLDLCRSLKARTEVDNLLILIYRKVAYLSWR